MKNLLIFFLFLSQTVFGVTAGKAWRVAPGASQPSWGAINLADTTNAVTGTLPASSLGTAPNFTGNAQSNSKNVVVSASNSSALAIIRGNASSGGAPPAGTFCGAFNGEGFTCLASVGTTNYTMTFTTAFSAGPSCTCTMSSGTCTIAIPTTTSVVVVASVGAAHWQFICVGPR